VGRAEKAYEFLRSAYDVRSSLAHGGTPNPKKMRALDGSSLGNINAFAQELDGVLRVALRAAIALHAQTGKFHDEKDWDALILRDDA